MGFCAPPHLLSTDGPIFGTEDPGFESIAAQDLGDFESFLSGLDSILAVALDSYTADVDGLAAYDVLLAAASWQAGVYDAAVIAPLIAEYAALEVAGDALAIAMAASIAIGPSFPKAPQVPVEPVLTVEVLCGACAGAQEGGGGGESPQPYPDPQPCPGYGFIANPCTPPGAAPTIPTPSPIPPPSSGCLNPGASGGYVAGPCPVEPTPKPIPEPPAPPPPNPPEPPAPPAAAPQPEPPVPLPPE